MKKLIGNILILIAISILIFIADGMLKNKQHQDQLIQSFAGIKTEAATSKMMGGFSTNIAPNLSSEAANEVTGILRIDSIDLKAPVVRGATPAKLNKSLGTIDGLDEPGTLNGSAAIAGHQSHVFGQFFNRLDELQIGDKFSLETISETLHYEVFDIIVVKPENVGIVKRQKGITLISLITCYPERSNQFRLVVQAKQI
ncbi:class D sortase [Bacillus sp. FJAT-22090]|uniref:class D sortase n=1 Tax=Bacillus sp. FJAT-22090 TaxID=1581038 RepID=UPI0011A872E7|nr:class D sortase [Bacillus sp. FJAT-22090]